jgi:type I restriction-modification system DNA methylase subunit
LIRDTFKRGKYQDVILPLTVLRRLDCVLAPSKDKVLKRQAELRGKGLQDLDAQLRKASGFAFYNTSRYDFDKLLADAPHIAANLRNYIAGFSPNMREVLEKFDFDNTISKLAEAGLLFQVLERFKNVDLHPDKIDNPTMGTIFEELIRKFNEALNENPGEHFTPRDVVHLMVDLMLAGDADRIRRKGIVCTVYDPCCGSGGMLMITKEHITVGLRKNGNLIRPPLNKDAEIHLFGQEVNPETWAVSKSDLFIKEPTGRDADNIALNWRGLCSNDLKSNIQVSVSAAEKNYHGRRPCALAGAKKKSSKVLNLLWHGVEKTGRSGADDHWAASAGRWSAACTARWQKAEPLISSSFAARSSEKASGAETEKVIWTLRERCSYRQFRG